MRRNRRWSSLICGADTDEAYEYFLTGRVSRFPLAAEIKIEGRSTMEVVRIEARVFIQGD